MPSRIATLFAALKTTPGELSRHGRHIIIFIAGIMLGAAVAVFIRTTWNQELSNDVIAFTALFVITALVLVGYARTQDNDRK